MRTKKLLLLEKKAIKLKKELIKIIDTIYEADEIFGAVVADRINDERFIRS